MRGKYMRNEAGIRADTVFLVLADHSGPQGK